jgi:hypothetical protein
MGDSDTESQSFIVKVWVEETDEARGPKTWRGHVTHVPSGERRYFQDFKKLIAFISTYLKQMGVRL